jgi:sulfite exporter TauE/SafE
MKEITKEEFDKAYNKYSPNGWIKFAYKYFSQSTTEKDIKLSKTISYILIGLFLVGFIGTILNVSKLIIGIATYVFGIVLASLVLYLFSAVILNNIRLNKIRKELGVTKEEYENLVDKFYIKQ